MTYPMILAALTMVMMAAVVGLELGRNASALMLVARLAPALVEAH